MKYPYGLAADLHFHPWLSFAKVHEKAINSRLFGLLSELRRCAHETHAAGGNTVVLAGDIFHVRGSVAPTVLNSVRQELEHCILNYQVNFIILAGNHDLEGKHSERLGSAVTALEMAGVTVINSSASHMPPFLFVPWYDSVDDLKEEIVSYGLSDKAKRDLIIHAPIDGVIEGLPAHGLTGDWLAEQGFRRVFAGHYHNHKCVHPGIEDKGGPVYSVGALAHHTWSDVATKAGFLLVHEDRVEWRKSHLPAFIDVDKLTEVDPAELPFIVEGNYVRVKLESATPKKVAELREELESMGASGVLIQAVPEGPRRDEVTAAVVATGATLEASIGEFVKAIEGPAEVLTEALKVLAEASAMEV